MALVVTPLFTPLHVRGKEFRNRIVMPPMVVLHGLTTPDGIKWYGRRARGGAAMVIIEATSVRRFGSELTAANLKPLVQAIHDGGALAAIQLFPVTFRQRVAPAELSRAEIEAMVEQYKNSTAICAEAGFDGVEPHGAHNFALNQFFSPEQNARTDEYSGTTMENRMRLALRIVRAIRPICGDQMLLLYRHTPVGRGYEIADSLVLARELVNAGVDILDISPSSVEYPADRAAPFKSLGAPVIAVNRLGIVERALEALNAGRCDLVAVGRQLIADPDWPLKVREGRFDEIVKCVECNEGCHGNLNKNIPVACKQWA
jgi:2,4-dienoyl-CoA reductase-like NADH-dependent reductase (Old Yellow Enzyme family)